MTTNVIRANNLRFKWFHRHRGFHTLEVIWVMPVVIYLVLFLWKINDQRTLIASFEEGASALLSSMGEELVQMSVAQRFANLFSDTSRGNEISQFKENWLNRGIEIEEIQITQTLWAQRRLKLTCTYKLKASDYLSWFGVRRPPQVLSISVNARVQSPFIEKIYWTNLGDLASELYFVQAPKVLFNQLYVICKTWIWRMLGS